MKIRLNHTIIEKSDENMLKSSIRGGMNYPTFHKMATGEWNTRALDLLARFLTACGYTEETLKGAKFSDIFKVSGD